MLEYHVCRMRELRRRRGITLAELAKAAGVSRQLINRIELEGDRQSPGHEVLIRRAFAAVIASRRAQLDVLERDLAASTSLFIPASEVQENGY